MGSSSFYPFGILHRLHIRIFHFKLINSMRITNKKDDFAIKRITFPCQNFLYHKVEANSNRGKYFSSMICQATLSCKFWCCLWKFCHKLLQIHLSRGNVQAKPHQNNLHSRHSNMKHSLSTEAGKEYRVIPSEKSSH